jgi:hypothetical protein
MQNVREWSQREFERETDEKEEETKRLEAKKQPVLSRMTGWNALCELGLRFSEQFFLNCIYSLE